MISTSLSEEILAFVLCVSVHGLNSKILGMTRFGFAVCGEVDGMLRQSSPRTLTHLLSRTIIKLPTTNL
jgi:hypothetical protein